jgi:HNH endonuclease
MNTVDIDLLRKLLRYDHETGKLFWLPRAKEDHPEQKKLGLWNSRYAGREAFTTKDRKGYLKSPIFNVTFRAHRVAWALFYGAWPIGQIDHINMDRADNRIHNMREASNGQNNRNRGVQSNNQTGYKGVFYDKRREKYVANLVVDGKLYRGGAFLDVEDAAASYANLCREHHGEFSRLQ